MLINFMKYPNNIIQPICFGNHQLEHVSTFKLLGVKIRHHLKFKDHIDYIYSKAAKDLHTLRVCKRAGVAGSNIINILSAPSDRYLHCPGMARYSRVLICQVRIYTKTNP